MIDTHTFDVIISDVMIQGGTIRELIQAVNNKHPDTVVIVNSDINTVQEGVRAVKEGAFGILQKPFSIPELNFQIKKAVEKKEKSQEAQRLPERHRQTAGGLQPGSKLQDQKVRDYPPPLEAKQIVR